MELQYNIQPWLHCIYRYVYTPIICDLTLPWNSCEAVRKSGLSHAFMGNCLMFTLWLWNISYKYNINWSFKKLLSLLNVSTLFNLISVFQVLCEYKPSSWGQVFCLLFGPQSLKNRHWPRLQEEGLMWSHVTLCTKSDALDSCEGLSIKTGRLISQTKGLK